MALAAPVLVRQTARLRLRPVEADDWSDILTYQQDARYLRYYPWEARTEAQVRHFACDMASGWDEQPQTRYEYAIMRRSEPDRVIGVVGLRHDRPSGREAELGFEIDPALWRRGYASEAARSVAAQAFDEMGLERLWASCIAENTASLRVLNKLGFTCELLLPHNRWMKDRWWDRHLCSLRREHWHAPLAPEIQAA